MSMLRATMTGGTTSRLPRAMGGFAVLLRGIIITTLSSEIDDDDFISEEDEDEGEDAKPKSTITVVTLCVALIWFISRQIQAVHRRERCVAEDDGGRRRRGGSR